jgi:hypothetical protein
MKHLLLFLLILPVLFAPQIYMSFKTKYCYSVVEVDKDISSWYVTTSYQVKLSNGDIRMVEAANAYV